MNFPTEPLTPEYDFRSCYLPYPTKDADITSFDYIIVGSGAGGGVSTATLQAAGNSCLVLEKGAYIPPFELTQVESEAMTNLYEKGGLLTTVDGNIMILAGTGLGGGLELIGRVVLIHLSGLERNGSTNYIWISLILILIMMDR